MLFLQGCSAKTLYYYDGDEKRILTPESTTQQRSSDGVHYYKDENDVLMGVSNRIIVKVAPQLDLEALMKAHGLTMSEKLTSELYVLSAPNADMSLDIANALTQEDGIIFAHPDFIKEVSPR